MENVRTFGDWLKKEMEAKGYNKSSLQRETGIDRAHIRRMENGEIEMPETPTREKLHAAFGTSDADLETLGILIREEFPRPDGSVIVQFRPGTPSPAADMGDVARITDLVGKMPDEAVQHLRRFLEALRSD